MIESHMNECKCVRNVICSKILCSNSVKIRYAFIAFIVFTVEAQISLYRLKYQYAITDRMYLPTYRLVVHNTIH